MECNYSDYINIKEQLENTQKEIEKNRTLLNTKLYEYNLTIQEQKKKIYQLQKELDEEKICHYLTKKLCIFPTKLKN